MIHEREEALNIIGWRSRSSVWRMQTRVVVSRPRAGTSDTWAADCYKLYLVSIHEYAAR